MASIEEMCTDGRAKGASRTEDENMWHFRDWKRNVGLDEEGTEGKQKHRMGEEDQEGRIQVFDIGCPVLHEGNIHAGYLGN
jgi:hypothetical protein